MADKKENLETKGIGVIFILEVMGRPPEHLTQTLKDILKKLAEEKGVSVKSKDIKEPTLMKDQKEFYTSFAEVEIEVEEMANLLILLFKYMPAHVEILNPELIALTNNGWNDLLNELTRRLHGYDEVARVLQHKTVQLQEKLKEFMPSDEVDGAVGKEDSKPEEKKK